MEEAVFPGNPNRFARYTVSAELIDNATDTVMLPFNFTDRAGHTTYDLAVNQAFILTEREINEKYPPILKGYLAALMPHR